MKKRATNPCKGCIWAERIGEELIFCPFPACVKGKLPTGQKRKEQGKPDEQEEGVGR